MISSHAVINLDIWEGATYYREFVWEVGDPAVAVNLDGYVGRMQARDSIEDELPVIDLNTTNGGIVLVTPADGVYAIYMSPDKTLGLCPDHERRVLVYDLFFDYVDGLATDTGLQQRGRIIINPAVTRAL